jgi:hypothetical protein
MIKELATVGYFTSKIGATEALDYLLPIPGKFDGCMPLGSKTKNLGIIIYLNYLTDEFKYRRN